MEKTYSYQERKLLFYIFMGIFFLFSFLLFLAARAAMGSGPFLIEIGMNTFVIILPVLAAVAFIYPFVVYPYTAIREIVFSKEGILLKRKFRPITIKKVTGLDIHKAPIGGREKSITITGLAPDGRKIRKTIMRPFGGDVGKKWEEFKKDLQEIKSK